MEKRICGTCKNFVPEGETMLERARAKYPWPHCKFIQDKIKPENTQACLVWMPKK
jgi:hypothetical protein